MRTSVPPTRVLVCFERPNLVLRVVSSLAVWVRDNGACLLPPHPGLRISNDEFHGITNSDVKHSPTFKEIAGDVLAYLSDAIVVSHNLDFEEKFLAAEFGRLGVACQGVPGSAPSSHPAYISTGGATSERTSPT